MVSGESLTLSSSLTQSLAGFVVDLEVNSVSGDGDGDGDGDGSVDHSPRTLRCWCLLWIAFSSLKRLAASR